MTQIEATTSFTVDLRDSMDVNKSLEVLRRPGDDLMDRWDGHSLVRTAQVDGKSVPYACRFVPNRVPHAGSVASVVAPLSQRDAVARVVGRTFVAPTTSFHRLLETDPILCAVNQRHPGIRPVLHHDLLTALVGLISAQQVNLTWAATTRARLARRFGTKYCIGGNEVFSLDAERLAQTKVEQLRELQFTSRKSESIIAVAREITAGALSLSDLERMEDTLVVERLTRLKGIGLWSAEWILCRTLGRPRVVAGDLGVRRVTGRAYLAGRLPSESDVRRLTQHWGQAATVTQELLLYGYQGWRSRGGGM